MFPVRFTATQLAGDTILAVFSRTSGSLSLSHGRRRLRSEAMSQLEVIANVSSSLPDFSHSSMSLAQRPSFHRMLMRTGLLSLPRNTLPCLAQMPIAPISSGLIFVFSMRSLKDWEISRHSMSASNSDQPKCGSSTGVLRAATLISLPSRSNRTHLTTDVPESIPITYFFSICFPPLLLGRHPRAKDDRHENDLDHPFFTKDLFNLHSLFLRNLLKRRAHVPKRPGRSGAQRTCTRP